MSNLLKDSTLRVRVGSRTQDLSAAELVLPPPPRTKWTRRVPQPVLIGHAGRGRERACGSLRRLNSSSARSALASASATRPMRSASSAPAHAVVAMAMWSYQKLTKS